MVSRSVPLRDVGVGKIFFGVERSDEFSFRCPEVGLENSISTPGRSRWTRSRRPSSQSSIVNRRRSILHTRSSTHRKTCAPPQPQREREFRTILIRPLDTSSGNSNPTSGHLKEKNLWTPNNNNSNPTCGHLELLSSNPASGHMEIANSNPTSGHLELLSSNPTSGHLKITMLNRPLDT